MTIQQQNIKTSLVTVQETETNITRTETEVRTELNNLIQQIGDQKTQFNNLFKQLTDSDSTLDTQRQQLKTLIIQNDELNKKAIETLGKANDIATFEEFNNVAESKDKIRWWWFALFVFITLAVGLLGWIIAKDQGWFDAKETQIILNTYKQPWQLIALYSSKLFVLPPLLGLAYFFLQRYLKESRIAEEYRFKATCALHFKSYMELVQKLCNSEHDSAYRDFLISQIHQLFTSPTDKIYKNSNAFKGGDLKAVTDTLDLVLPQFEKLRKVFAHFT